MANPDMSKPNLYGDSRDNIHEIYGNKNPASDYGWRGQVAGIGAVERAISIKPVTAEGPEQLDLFSAQEEPNIPDKQPSSRYRYGHVAGASAERLRESDLAFIKNQQRKGKEDD